MSSTLRIALVAEGVTDYVVLKAAVESMLNGQSFDMKLLQPEGSVAFIGQGDAGPFGGGWKGVYRWCDQAADRGGGTLSGDPLFLGYDVLVLHLDADVAGEDPANAQVPMPHFAGVLPCEKPCPPPGDTTDALRTIMLTWVGESATPAKTVLCTPSKSIEAWVMAICFPTDREMIRKGWECHPKPETRLNQQPKKRRFKKTEKEYEKHSSEITSGWTRVAKSLSEANRFQDDFKKAARRGE